MEDSRETGRVKKWSEKGFGFIGRDQGGSVFCHARETPGRTGLTAGSMVSFLYESDDKGGKATQVQVEEAAEEDTSARETGTIKRWNADKGFGFIGRDQGGDDAFVHKKDCARKDLVVGQPVSFVFEEGPKGASAKNVKEEGEVVVPVEEDKSDRELGKVKSYNEEKGFGFIGRCAGGDDLFAHKKEFGDIRPYPGQGVSFVVKTTEKGDAAKKVLEEENVPDLPTSDGGREFGTIKVRFNPGSQLQSKERGANHTHQDFNIEKGWGSIIRKAGGDNARFFDKACTAGLIPEKGLCVSFLLEQTDKGPSAKDLREEDPERVRRLTAEVYYGRVDEYYEPTVKKPTNGYGFIVPFNLPSYGAPKRYFFHMSEIETPDEDGGIEPGSNVSFIVLPAKKGVQAAAVTIADPPSNDNDKENVPALKASFADMGVKDDGNAATEDDMNDGWGTWGA